MAEQNGSTYRCRPRFKGLEGFFRRIAFNLGNSPSQTEVKVVSCIPIDVTDLQHRIVTLEQELERYQQPGGAGGTVMRSTQACAASHRGEPPGPLPEPLMTSTTSTPNKSNPSLAYHSSQHPERMSPQPSHSCEIPPIENCRCETHSTKMRPSQKKNTSKDRTELVYFAQQANRTPFSACNTPYSAYDQLQSTSKDSPIENMFSHGYLKDIARKQWRQQTMPSNESQFSSPICRDNGTPRKRPAPACVSDDVCSCCRGNFHDVDVAKRVVNKYDIPSAPNDHLSMYYDSSMYDLVPVKERQDDISPKKKDKKKENLQAQLKYAHEKIYRSRMQPYTVAYSNGAIKNSRRMASKRKRHVKSPNRSVPKRRHEQFTIDRGFPSKISEELYQDVELQTYCMKPLRKARRPSPPRAPPVTQKNAECLTISVINTECQTASTKSVQLDIPAPPQANNEATLDQIKTILQTVLTEVKTNVREKIQETQKSQEVVKPDPKKDAEVQKGASQKNMAACSSLMSSFYYSPYNMNPYTASCSPFHLNNCYPAMKCFQNYPLFIQTTGRQCDLCTRKPQGSSKVMPKRPAANNGTNTESAGKTEHSKETEKLIQEIYKSIAVNFDVTSKEATSECDDDFKSEPSEHNFNRKFAKESNLSKRREPVKTARTREPPKKMPATLYMNPTFNTTRNSDEVSVHVAHVTTARKEGIQRTVNLLTQPRDSSAEESDHRRAWRKKKEPVQAQTYSDKTVSVDVDLTPSEVTVISAKKKEKPSLFAKMCKVFKGKNKKNDPQPSEVGSAEDDVEEFEASDSDDYQTVISERDDTRGRRMVTAAHVHMPSIREQRYRRTSHSKVAYPRYVPVQTRPPERPRRYAQQEFRRPQWNEGISLVTPGRAAKQAYEQARARKYETKYSDRVSPYWQNYETRHAHVEREPSPKEETRKKEPREKADQDDYERKLQRRRNKHYEQDEPKVFKSVAKKLQWFKKPNMECRHKLKKLLVDT